MPAIFLLASTYIAAAEYAVLKTGALIYAERYEMVGSRVRLYANEGVIELNFSAIAAFRPAEKLPATAPAPGEISEFALQPHVIIDRAARRYGANSDFVHLVQSVAKVESDHRQNAVSPKGAIGLMQLMPATARELDADPHDPEQNADAGARYLRDLLLRYKDDPYQLRMALAAYNAGPGAVDRYKGVPPYRETTQYVEKVIREFTKRQALRH